MASASQCFNLALYNTPGTTSRVVFDYSGIITGRQTVQATVGAITSFEGVSAREVTATTSGTNTVAGLTVAIDTSVKSYQNAAANGETTQYGAVVTANTPVAGFNVTSTSRTVFSPPWVDRRFTMTAGQTLTQTYTGTTTTSSGGILGSPGTTTTVTTTTTQSIRFVGIESVTVPAGTFSACKFEDSDPAVPGSVTTTWLATGHGTNVKSVGSGPSGTQTIEAVSVQINGAAP